MFFRLGASIAIIAGIFAFSPVRRGEDPVRLVANAKEAVLDAARQNAAGAALAGAAAVSSSAGSELRPTLEGLVARALAEGARPAAARSSAPASRAALDTLTADDRRPAWKGLAAG